MLLCKAKIYIESFLSFSKRSFLDNRRRNLEKRRDNCTQSIRHLIHFHTEGKIPEFEEESGDDGEEDNTPDSEKKQSEEQASSSTTEGSTPLPKPILQSVAAPVMSSPAKETTPRTVQMQMPSSPPPIQRVTTPDTQQKPAVVSQTVQMPAKQTVPAEPEPQQFLEIVGSDGRTQLLQIVGGGADQQVVELVTIPEQQSMQTFQKDQVEQQVVQYVTETGHVVENQEQVIISDEGLQEQVVEEHVVADDAHEQIILSDGQQEQIILTGGGGEQVVVTGYPQEQVVQEVVLEGVPSVPQREAVAPRRGSRIGTNKPTLQSLLRKQPQVRSTPRQANVSVLRPQVQQQQMLQVILTQGVSEASQGQTIYAVPSSSQTSVVSASSQQRLPHSSVVITSEPASRQQVHSDNIIETAFAAATQEGGEEIVHTDNSTPQVAVQVTKPHIVVQQPHVAVGQSHSAESMNIDDIEVQPLQASQEDIMRTMESIASELLGVSSIDLAP